MANILTDPAATYAAAAVLATTKVNAQTRTEAESDEIAIAQWFTEIDNAAKKINAFLVGSQSAGIAGNTTTLLGALSVAQALAAASAAITGAVTAASATLTGAVTAASATIGDGTGTPTLALNKVATGQARIDLKDAGVLRWREAMDGGENFVIERYDAAGALVDTPLSIDDATGNIAVSGTVDGVDLAAHASRHASGGADAVKLDDLAAPDDNTDLNASATTHGLLPKLSGSTPSPTTWAVPANVIIMAADEVNDNATPNTLENLTGMAFSVTAGETYWFSAVIPYTAAATTTGSRWVTSGPAITMLNGRSQYTLTATTLTSNYFSAHAIPAACNASSLTAGNVALVEGIFKPSASGTLQLQFASEVASSAITAKAGAILQWRRVA